MAQLLHPRYGKARVRVLKVTRRGTEHSLKELTVSVQLSGNFATSYTQGDNSLVVPTDTMKNTVNVLAKQKLGSENEEFGVALGEHFLQTYPQVDRVEVGLVEHGWERLRVGGQPHPHAFRERGAASLVANVVCTRQEHRVESGITDLLILKSTDSGFEGFPRDEFTTLRETRDRIFATKVKATWTYTQAPQSYSATNTAILDALLEVFARRYSPSVQTTLFQMGEAALNVAAEISQITLVLPNQHCLLLDLSPFGLTNTNEVFVPTDEPHGIIEGTITRDSAA